MEHSGSVGKAINWFSHTAFSEICVHAFCHMDDISLAKIPLWKRAAQLVEP